MEKIFLEQTECISLRARPTLSVGSMFQSDIYYSFEDRIAPRHGVFYFEGDELFYLEYERDAFRFGYGSELRICGLLIINLGDRLLISARYGDLRVRKRREYAPY